MVIPFYFFFQWICLLSSVEWQRNKALGVGMFACLYVTKLLKKIDLSDHNFL